MGVELIVHIPGLIPDDLNASEMEQIKQLKLNGLFTCLSKAKLYHKKTVQPSIVMSEAAISAIGDQLPSHNDFYLRIDPVELRADLAAVYMLGNDHLAVTGEESQQLAMTLQQLLRDFAIELHVPHPKRWYLQSKEPFEVNTPAPDELLGKDIFNYLPQGRWNQMLTEIQMVLHQSEVNHKRQRQGLPLINSVWLWGGKTLSTDRQFLLEHDISKCFVDEEDVNTRGLAYLNNIPVDILSLNNISLDSILLESGKYLLTDLSLQSAWRASDFSNWSKHVCHLERHLFTPVVAAIKKNKLTKITLYSENRVYELKRSSLRCFWRKGGYSIFAKTPRRKEINDCRRRSIATSLQ